MENFTTLEQAVSSLHIGAAVLGMLTGAFVLFTKKGTKRHKQVGYVFFVALLATNGTAFFIYRLTGTFNFLHIFGIISLVSLAVGMYYAMKRPGRYWLNRHITWMNAAALGVWAAAVAETTIRVLPMYLGAQGIIYFAIGVGVLFFVLIGLTNYQFIKKYGIG